MAISIKDRKRLTKSPPLKGGGPSSKAKSQKSDKSQRKWDRRFREMEICLAVQLEIERGPIKSSAVWEISMSEVLIAIAKEPDGSKILSYFNGT